MELLHHGGHQGVTGSCHQLKKSDGRSILIDCGLFQGQDAKDHPSLEIDFDLTGIETLVLTHVHIDHVGRLPYLLAAGFRGDIVCSHPTASLLPLVIEDALRIGFTRNKRMIAAFQQHVADRLKPMDYGTFEQIEGFELRLTPAGHILGSASVEVETGEGRAVFSGDLGAPHAPILKDPQSPPRADLMVLESTYGDKVHQGREERGERLEAVLRHTLEDKGVTIIPAFSLGRTQELLYEMNRIFERIQKQSGRSIMKQVDVIVDSPLASRFTEIYKSLQSYWDGEAQRILRIDDQPLVFENLTTVGSHDEHQSTLDYLAKSKLPAIVLAGSGMCTGGRVVNYLKAFLDQPSTDVVFVGYQGRGTPGRIIQSGRNDVELDGQTVPIRAKIHTLSGYSAHADQANLLDFVKKMETPPGEVVLVHGEPDVQDVLRGKIAELGIAAR